MIETPHDTAINPLQVFEVSKPHQMPETKEWVVAVVTSYGEEVQYAFRHDQVAAQTFYNLVSRFSPFAS